MMTFGSLFSGIGGFDLGLERAGMSPGWQVEIDPFCQSILAKHWPDIQKFKDIKDCGGHNLESVDLVCGGFPCQPYSVAGKQRGSEDDRALWPEMLRVIKETEPRWVIGENVAGIISMELDKVLSDLEGIGYETQAFVIPACAVNAPHRRDRVWILAYSEGLRLQGVCLKENCGRHIEAHGATDESTRTGADGYSRITTDSDSSGLEKLNPATIAKRQGFCSGFFSDAWAKWPAQPPVCGGNDGIPHRLDRLRALGNAIVPQIAEILGRLILETEALI